jgi:exopolysaccharide biosynthesis predicted pyruvyltransferase EpsI
MSPVPSKTAIDGIVTRSVTLVDDAIRQFVPADAPCVICDVPVHDNWGDSAIHVGTRIALQRSGRAVLAELDASIARARLIGLPEDAVVLISGGGNFGDLYPHHQTHREWILDVCRHVPVVQLPQSIHFTDPQDLDRAQRALARHPQVTLLVRDQPSLDFATRHFDVPVHLVPDFAFGMGPQSRAKPPQIDVLWQRRRDGEARARTTGAPMAGVVCGDWSVRDLGPIPHLRGWPTALDRNLRRVERRLAPAGAVIRPVRARILSRQARVRTQLALQWLARGRVVVTDRLHGHILCLLLGTPHVLLDNAISKLSAYHDTWTASARSAFFAETEQDALARALSLAPARAT